MGVHGKIRVQGGGGAFTKNQNIGRIALKEGAWTVCRFKGRRGLGKKEGGGVFEGGDGVDTPMHTMQQVLYIKYGIFSAWPKMLWGIIWPKIVVFCSQI